MFALAEENDPVVVSVNEVTFTLSMVQPLFENAVLAYIASGMTDDRAMRNLAAQQVIQACVDQGVMDLTLAALGFDAPSPEESARITALQEESYDALIAEATAQVMTAYGVDAAKAKEYAISSLDMQGYSRKIIYAYVLEQSRAASLAQYVAGDITLTNVDIDAYFERTYVEPQQAHYENDLLAFDVDTQRLGIPAFYIPAGYRRVKALILPLPEDIASAIAVLQAQRAQSAQDAQDALTILNDAQASDQEKVDAQAQYDSANTEMNLQQGDAFKLEERAMITRAAQMDEIIAKYTAGESFDALIDAFGDKTGLPQDGFLVRERATIWPTNFRRAAMNLKQIGDISAPFATEDGVMILKYLEEYSGGARRLTISERDALRDEALLAAKTAKLEEFLRGEAEKFTVVTESEFLFTPKNE